MSHDTVSDGTLEELGSVTLGMKKETPWLPIKVFLKTPYSLLLEEFSDRLEIFKKLNTFCKTKESRLPIAYSKNLHIVNELY